MGFGSDNIDSCRLTTVTGELIDISATSNPELLYAIKGADQYFGIVKSLSVRIQPLSILNTLENTVWSGQMVFDASRANEVLEAVVQVQKTSTRSAGSYVFGAPPPMFQPYAMLIGFHLGTAADTEANSKPVLDLKPYM